MIPVSSAAQVRDQEQRVIRSLGVPGIALMETASRGVAAAVRERFGVAVRAGVVVVCGSGNNGGDGYGCARWLAGWGIAVRTVSLATSSKGDAATMREACARIGVPDAPWHGDLGPAGVIVDAVFGTGLDRAVTGDHAAAITAMAAHPAPVVAVDVPSGLHSDTGAVLGVCAPAALTVTIGRWKPGLLAEPGADLAGAVEVVDIGLEIAPAPAAAEIPERGDIASLWPVRAAADHKGRSGHLLVVAGGRAMTGAAILACRGALAAGVGLLTLVAPRGAGRVAGLPPEVMLLDGGDGDGIDRWDDAWLTGRTALAAGPGLGALAPAVRDGLSRAWAQAGIAAVFDADALPASVGGRGERVITPHPGEAARILGCTVAAVNADRFAAARDLAAGRVALLKGRNTLIAAAGSATSVNRAGHTTLATGGSGDVLTGVIGALLARGVPARDAAILGAYVHGRAGERLAARRSQGWTASDVAAAVPDAIEELIF